jgi:hypothetical protein
VLTGGELEILRQAARAVDEADRLERELRKQPPLVAGHAGQPRPNPLNKMLDDKRELIRRLVADLHLPDDDEEVGRTPSQRKAAHAAAARWAQAR